MIAVRAGRLRRSLQIEKELTPMTSRHPHSLSLHDYSFLGLILAQASAVNLPRIDEASATMCALDRHVASMIAEDWAISEGKCPPPQGKWECWRRQYLEEDGYVLAMELVGAIHDAALVVGGARDRRMVRQLGPYPTMLDDLTTWIFKQEQHGVDITAANIIARAEALYRSLPVSDRPPGAIVEQAARIRVAAEVVVGHALSLRTYGIVVDRDPRDCVGLALFSGLPVLERHGTSPPHELVDAHDHSDADAFATTCLAGQMAYDWVLYSAGYPECEIDVGSDRWNRARELLRQHDERIEQVADALPVNVILVELPLEEFLVRFHLE